MDIRISPVSCMKDYSSTTRRDSNCKRVVRRLGSILSSGGKASPESHRIRARVAVAYGVDTEHQSSRVGECEHSGVQGASILQHLVAQDAVPIRA